MYRNLKEGYGMPDAGKEKGRRHEKRYGGIGKEENHIAQGKENRVVEKGRHFYGISDFGRKYFFRRRKNG